MNEADLCEIDISDILCQEIGSNKRVSVNLKFIDLDIRHAKPITGYIDLTNIGEQILAGFQLKTVLCLNCNRCLNEFNVPIKLKFSIEYGSLDDGLSEGNPILSNYKIGVLDQIRQELIINVPLKPLCQENCQGIKGIKIKQE